MGELRGNKEVDNEVIIDWSKFRSNAKGNNLEKAKRGFMKFCKMLDDVGFELVGDYVGTMNKIELTYKLDNSIRLNMSPDNFKRTYKIIVNFKNELRKNNDEFIKFVSLTNGNSLIAKIKTFDGGFVGIGISRYELFNKARRDFYDKLNEVNGYTEDYYINKETKMDIYIDEIKLNSISSHTFKAQTYTSIVNFKNNLFDNNDKFVKFTGLTNTGNLIAKINTFDGGAVCLDVSRYESFGKGRESTYDYCEEKGYRILSPYMGNQEKILIDFNCGHKPNWILPSNLKSGQCCSICLESKGENTVRQYLENNNMGFIQEYRFEECKHKRSLSFDFYISQYNLCVEYDGEQHYKAFEYFGGEESFKLTQKRDNIKNNYCKDNNINLLRIPYWELNNIEKILDEEFKKLREYIKDNIA